MNHAIGESRVEIGLHDQCDRFDRADRLATNSSVASGNGGFTARSFSIKNHANLPWNALDLGKITGLCCIQLKLQLSPKPTQRR